MFLMWLGEQITSRGIGNGVSLIIMAGIAAQLSVTLTDLFQSGREGAISGLLIIGSLGMALCLAAFICFLARALRRLLIQYPKRQPNPSIMQADSRPLPTNVNLNGVIPPIFS